MIIDLTTGLEITSENPENENSILWDTDLGQDYQKDNTKSYVLSLLDQVIGEIPTRFEIETSGDNVRYKWMEWDMPMGENLFILSVTPVYLRNITENAFLSVKIYVINIKLN